MTDFDGFRIGHGYDAHRRMTPAELSHNSHKKHLVLGGVEFVDEVPLVGHSDADVVSHAVIDALLNAAGLGDIGEMFPDTDPSNAGANSLALLSQSAEAISAAGWQLVNADCTVVTDRPMLAPHKPQMQQLLSAAACGQVTVSGKRTEGLTTSGSAEGIVAFAVALLARKR